MSKCAEYSPTQRDGIIKSGQSIFGSKHLNIASLGQFPHLLPKSISYKRVLSCLSIHQFVSYHYHLATPNFHFQRNCALVPTRKCDFQWIYSKYMLTNQITTAIKCEKCPYQITLTRILITLQTKCKTLNHYS